jgi:DNA-binding NarL/FixJ family response regulator
LVKIRVILADDHPFLRTSIRKILDKTPDILVVGEAGDGIQALDLVKTLSPDVLVLDVEMPNLNGIQVAQQLHADGEEVRILALSAYDDRAHILGMLDAGVAGYLTKDEALDGLVKAIRGLAQGKDGWFSQRVADKIGGEVKKKAPEELSWTDRERSFLRLLAEGKTNPQIEAELGLSEKTLERYYQVLYLKLDASSPEQLVNNARQAGLL